MARLLNSVAFFDLQRLITGSKGNARENDWRESLEVLSESFSIKESQLTIGEDYPSYPGGYGFNIETKDGTAFVAVDRALGTVFVNTAGLKSTKAGAGSQVYQMVATFAKNNGLSFAPDETVSGIAQNRRISHMASSALRHGTTEHFDGQATYTDKATGQTKTEVPGWKPGDHDHNLDLLLKMEHAYVMQEAQARGIDLSHLTYDQATSTLLDGHTGTPITQDTLGTLVDRFKSGDSGVGETTLLRALVTGSALQRGQSDGGVHHLQKDAGGMPGRAEAGRPGGELVSVARGLYYSRPSESAGGVPSRRLGDAVSGRSGGLAATLAETTRFLNEKQPGLVNQNTHLFTSVDELLASDYARARGFDADDIAEIRTAEGFYDPDTGHSVIVAENTRLRDGETPQQAITRVVLHERASHDGLRLLLGQPDSVRSRRWAALSAKIPQQELDAIAGEKGYQHLAGKRDDLAFEWLARKTETDMSLLEKGSLPQRMWDEFREMVLDLLASVGHKPTLGRSFDMQVQDLKIRARNAALQGGKP